MSRPPNGQCLVCLHPDRCDIEQRIQKGEAYRSIAEDYDFSTSTCYRHFENGHMVSPWRFDPVTRRFCYPRGVRNVEKMLEVFTELEPEQFELLAFQAFEMSETNVQKRTTLEGHGRKRDDPLTSSTDEWRRAPIDNERHSAPRQKLSYCAASCSLATPPDGIFFR